METVPLRKTYRGHDWVRLTLLLPQTLDFFQSLPFRFRHKIVREEPGA